MKLTTAMAGRTVHSAWKRDNLIEIRFTDGTSLKLGWRDGNGELLHGEPDILFEGTHIVARTQHLRRPQPLILPNR